ncbi:carbohydrate kinase family protein [Pseudonocardia sp. KRD291]|uniref:carbohydrate kinase family protein n=1 Tax=Pseudonocardia sp. KRD291 TaxID=2792007 RepID=UPI001C4A08DB|nr:sugar kinase [Pseudonocardia sp. KRD291]MBW0103980.1 sugar kinase [Pseudonocardia sp. KRD291]
MATALGRRGRVVALGPHIVDVLGRPIDHIPAGQGSAVVDEITMTVAGTGGGAAMDLAKLGWSVTSMGVIGDDVPGALLTTLLTRRGIDVSGLVVRPGQATAATILPIRSSGERPALHSPGAMRGLRPADLDVAALRRADVLLLGGPEVTPQLLSQEGLALLREVHDSGVTVVVDLLHPATTDTAQRLAGLLPLVDWFLPNDDQLRGLTGVAELGDAARALLDLGVGAVAVTTGARGALVVRPGAAPTVVPAFPTAVVDTTGCGDAFNAGMITGIAAGCSPEDSALLGCACGSLTASGLGSDAGITDLDQVLHLVAGTRPAEAARITTALGRTGALGATTAPGDPAPGAHPTDQQKETIA